jgi:hypothetical protein
MYYIKKYANCWAVHNDETGASRPLTEVECDQVKEEFPNLSEKQTKTVFADCIRSIENLP